MHTAQQEIQTAEPYKNIVIMEPFSTCVIKIKSEGERFSPLNYQQLLCELDHAIKTQDYQIICLGDHTSFSLKPIEHGEAFATYIQFDFPVPVAQMEHIEQEIKNQIEGACSLDILAVTDSYRLLLVEKCDISFK
ncbi:MAG: hypothetical protein DI539_05115 [Flavobacterium psychrophilum]|nr:MAG: hypothetical protein DI539_05115 [Flavobacterium psychrophilum]